MKRNVWRGVLLALAATTALTAGCKKPAEAAAQDGDQTQVKENTLTQGDAMTHEHGKHGHHHNHRFDNPEEYAARWNDPSRDAWQRPEEIIKAARLEPGMKVADIGAGTGYMVAHLSRAVGEGGEVFAIDVEESMVRYIAERKAELGPAKISPRKAAHDSPAIASESIDAAVTINVWHHLAAREAYARKVFEGLKPGGTFVVVDFELSAQEGPPVEMRLAPEQIILELEGAGFEVSRAEESMPRHYMIVGRRPATP